MEVAKNNPFSLNLSAWWDSLDPQAAYFLAYSEPIALTDNLNVGGGFSVTAFQGDAAAAMGPRFALDINENHQLYAGLLFGVSSFKEEGANDSFVTGNYSAPWGFENPYFNIEWQSLYLEDAWFHSLGGYIYVPLARVGDLNPFGGIYFSPNEGSVGGVVGLNKSF